MLHGPEDEARAELAEALSSLEEAETIPHTHPKRGDVLDVHEIKDYDHYFQFEHVSSNDPALTLVRSLIETCLAFFQAHAGHPTLDPTHVEKQKQGFIEGAIKNGIAKDVAAGIFLKIEPFAEYGFNKSHAAAYAIISYQTAFLKTYYPK